MTQEAQPEIIQAGTGWEIDLSQWQTVGPILDWSAAAREADFARLIALMAQVIRQWPFAPDPTKPEDYRQLTPMEFQQALAQVSAALGDSFRR